MSDFDWKKLVGTVAPTLATALGGPLAGMATKAIAAAVLGNPDASEDELAQAMQSATPETMLALKKADQDFAVRMKELGVDLKKIAAEDRASAREMQVKTGSWAVPTLATISVAGFFVVVGWVLSGKVGLDNTLLGMVLGQVSAKVEQIYNFFFGSSAGSKEKTAQLAKQMKA